MHKYWNERITLGVQCRKKMAAGTIFNINKITSAKMQKEHFPHTLGLSVAMEMKEAISHCYDEEFTWLEEILIECKKAFARPEVELLPKTPSTTRRRKTRRKIPDDDDDCEMDGSAGRHSAKAREEDEDAGKTSSNSRSTRVTRSKKVSSNAQSGSQRTTRSTRSRKKDATADVSPVYSMVASMTGRHNHLLGELQDCVDCSGDKTPVGRQLTRIRSPSPRAVVVAPGDSSSNSSPQPTGGGKRIQRKFSVRQKANAYEDMLANRNSRSPASSPRMQMVLIGDSSPTPATPPTITRSPAAMGAVTPPTPDTVTQPVRSAASRPSDDRRSARGRRSSRASLKVLASKSHLMSARGRSSTGTQHVREALQTAAITADQDELTSQKRPRTRLRLKKKSDNDVELPKEAEVPTSSSDTTGSEGDKPPTKRPCRETDSIVDTNPRISFDKLYKEVTEKPKDLTHTAAVARQTRASLSASDKACPIDIETDIKMTETEGRENKKQVQKNSDKRDAVSGASESERQSNRTKTRKNVEAQKKSQQLAGSESSESDYERPVRHGTRTKTRANSKPVGMSESEFSGSVSSDEQPAPESRSEGLTEIYSRDEDEDNGDQERDSGIVSAQTSELMINISAKQSMPMEPDITEEEEEGEYRASTQPKTRSATSKSSSNNTDSSACGPLAPDESTPRTRTKTRKRLAEEKCEEVRSPRHKRSCTSSVTADQMSCSTPFNSDDIDIGEEDMDVSLQPVCPEDKIVRPHPSSFLNSLHKSSNIGIGMTSFIKKTQNTPNKFVQQFLQDMRKKDLEEKQRKDNERIQKRKVDIQLGVEEKRRKREDRIRKVMEHREEKERREQQIKDSLAKKLEERQQNNDKVKEEKLKEEKELKAKLRTKKQLEAEERRKQDDEEKQRRKEELEVENRRYLELMQRKKEFEELERQKKIAEERRKHEERMAENDRDREVERLKVRQMEEEREKEKIRIREERDKAMARDRAERDKQEIEKKCNREAALKREMEKLRELEKKRQQKMAELEDEERKKDDQVKALIKHHNQNLASIASNLASHASKSNLNSTFTSSADKSAEFTSYEITPAKKRVEGDNYNIDDLDSEDSTDEEDQPRKRIPPWAQDKNLRAALVNQHYHPPELNKIFGVIDPPDLNVLFKKHKPRFNKRTSSAIWDSPLYKPSAPVL